MTAVPPAYEIPEMPPWLTRYMRGIPNNPALAAWTKENTVDWIIGGELKWRSNAGPQTWVQWANFDEVCIGGRRGGSKTAALIARMVMGDPYLHELDPARTSFLNDPSFRGLFVRKEYQAMAEFVDEAMEFFRPFNCRLVDDPAVFVFNTDKTGRAGAKIYTAHLGDKEAFEKFRGWGITRIGVEELTQIPEERWYLKLLGSLRGKKQTRPWGAGQLSAFWKGQPEMLAKIPKGGLTFPALKTQIMSTTNPDGPGREWVKSRFVRLKTNDPRQPDGNIPWNTPSRDMVSGLRRIFIPMRLEDNPYLRDNQQYKGMLASQDEVTRRQWVEGDWDAGVGIYFDAFRPDGPRTNEEREKYPWARHVIEPVELKPWWFRSGGGDWGYSHLSVFHKACRNEQDGRLHIYDELALRQIGSFEMGVLVGKWWLPDLEDLPDKSVTIYLSPDAFSKTDATKTKAEQIAAGIQQVLGPYGAFLLKYNDDERAAMARDPKAAEIMFERRKGEMSRGQMCIVLKSANTDRIAGWSYLQDLLRFRPVLQETQEEIKDSLRKIYDKSGVEAYERELSAYRKRGKEVLPRMVLWKKCREAIRFLTEAQRDEAPRGEDVRKWDAVDGVGGDDGGDSLRHLAMGFKDVQSVIPKSYWVNERIGQFQEEQVEAFGEELVDPTRLAMVAATAAHRYQRATGAGPKTFNIPRASSSRHRMVQ